jgi:hypothetical protein
MLRNAVFTSVGLPLSHHIASYFNGLNTIPLRRSQLWHAALMLQQTRSMIPGRKQT